jgi:small subunit ribosomal protein S3
MHVSGVEIERNEKIFRIIIGTSRPGLIIGRSGEGATKLRKEIDMLFRTLKLAEMPEIKIDIEELRSPETSASIVGQMVVEGLEKRMPFRRVMKQTAEKVMANRDVKGIRIITQAVLVVQKWRERRRLSADGCHFRHFVLTLTTHARPRYFPMVPLG